MCRQFGIVAGFTLWFAPIAALAQTACEPYEVAPGDTLNSIAMAAYGTRQMADGIYSTNTQIIGPDRNTIEIGMILELPCQAGPVAVSTETPAATPPPPRIAPDTPALLSVGDFPPFSGIEGRGMINDIVVAALGNSGFGDMFQFFDLRPLDQAAQAAQALPTIVLSYPWVRPDCDNTTGLSAQSRNLCQNYTFSQPVYALQVSLYALDTPVDIHAPTYLEICSTGFYPAAPLAAIYAIVETRPSVAICLNGLIAGEFDAIVADSVSVKGFLQTGLVPNPEVTWNATLHAIAFNGNPDAMRALALFDQGLEALKQTGEWFAIVSEHLNRLP